MQEEEEETHKERNKSLRKVYLDNSVAGILGEYQTINTSSLAKNA
jgi:hypothetical protein